MPKDEWDFLRNLDAMVNPESLAEQEARLRRVLEQAGFGERAAEPQPSPPEPKEVLAARRREMLKAWENATGGKRSHLYTRRDGETPKINKQGFYDWLAGELSEASKSTRRLEAFLADHRFRPPRR
jgi:hypothetical protein